jgi:phage terminase large subunit-like protein
LKLIERRETNESRVGRIPTDWADFARLTRIRSGTKVIHFEPYPYQIALVNAVKRNYGTIVGKTRQMGITECIASDILHRAALNPGFTAIVLSRGQAESSNVAKRLKSMADSIPELIELETRNTTDLRIKGGGRILFKPATPNSCRGYESVAYVVMDECAFIENIDQLYLSVLPSTEAVGDEARIVLISTPNGRSGFFWDRLNSSNGNYDVLEESMKLRQFEVPQGYTEWTDKVGWSKFLLHWTAHPTYGRDHEYIDRIVQQKQLSRSAAEQEYDLSFNESSNTIFNPDDVRACAIGEYAAPESNGTYYMSLDSSMMGRDYTVCTIGKWEGDQLKVVKLYRERKKTIEEHIAAIGKLIHEYRPIAFSVEKNGCGEVYLQTLIKEHPNVRFEPFVTTRESKNELITRLNFALEQRFIRFPLSAIVDELLIFRKDGTKLEAPSGGHDDCVMAIAFLVSVTPFRVKSNPRSFDLSMR